MPRPTAAQFTYGALTVVTATLAMLILSQARSGLGVTVIAVAALALGLLVAVTVTSATTARTSTAAGRRDGTTRGTRELPAQPATSQARAGTGHRAPASLRQ
ncbi:hypothetical protein N566_27795 [Streptomycetaceae bacterium MP113-05]|nr:hypothetical protein N566_27795 [Streptomycetaceae bacterium MP113-05]